MGRGFSLWHTWLGGEGPVWDRHMPLFICLFKMKQRQIWNAEWERERNSYHELSTINYHNSHDRAWQKPGDRNSNQIFHVDGRNPTSWHLLPRMHQQELRPEAEKFEFMPGVWIGEVGVPGNSLTQCNPTFIPWVPLTESECRMKDWSFILRLLIFNQDFYFSVCCNLTFTWLMVFTRPFC